MRPWLCATLRGPSPAEPTTPERFHPDPMHEKSTSQSAFFNLRALVAVLVCAAAACSILAVPLLAFFRSDGRTNVSNRTLTLAERVAYQRAIEDVYWRHRI